MTSQSAEAYWRSYLSRPPKTTPASLMLEAKVEGIVVWNVIPRLINNAGDQQYDVAWHENDRIVDTNSLPSSFEKKIEMQDRNWTTPFQVRERIDSRRYEKPCEHNPKGDEWSYTLQAYDTCVIKLYEHQKKEYIKAMANRGKKGITEVPLYIDHRSQMYSWVETCDSRKCTWKQN